jgi:hypothetical protein
MPDPVVAAAFPCSKKPHGGPSVMTRRRNNDAERQRRRDGEDDEGENEMLHAASSAFA